MELGPAMRTKFEHVRYVVQQILQCWICTMAWIVMYEVADWFDLLKRVIVCCHALIWLLTREQLPEGLRR